LWLFYKPVIELENSVLIQKGNYASPGQLIVRADIATDPPPPDTLAVIQSLQPSDQLS
jgi:hypothetical protein